MKKIYALILAVVMTISLFGCSNGNDPVGTTEPTVETTVAPTETTEAPTETTVAPTTTPTEATEAPTVAPTEKPTEPVKPTEATTAPTEPVETQHTHSYTSKTTAPTCENKGYTTYTCACGHSYTGDETKATGHNYSTTTVAPTATEDGYDLHKCANCGKEYRDNYVPKTNSESGLAHEGMYWRPNQNTGENWVAHDCATQGHVYNSKGVVVQERTCYQVEIKERTCIVVGCGFIERIEGPDNEYGYDHHTRSVNDITGYVIEYLVRRYDGLTWTFDNEADARAKAKEIVDAYKNGECVYWLDWIWCEKFPIAPEQYTCTVCGKNTDNKLHYWNGETESKELWFEKYTEDTQP